MFAPLAFVAAALSLSSFVGATPTTTRRAANNFCDQLLITCAASGSTAINDPWSIPACIYGATCFGGSRPVDGFLAAVAAAQNTAAKASLNVPRLTVATYDRISTDKQYITQQNFIDGVYSTLDFSNGPYPDVSLVISSFQRVVVWTAFCNSRGIPYMNFADYFQYSPTVSSPGCALISTIPVPEVTTTIIDSSPGPANPTPPPIPVISSEKSCQQLFVSCVAAVNPAVSDAWSHNSCFLAATCFGGQRPVDGLLSVVFTTKTGKSSSIAPTSLTEARLSVDTLKKISTNGSTITQQNWIDAYYGQLALTGGPWPDSSSIVIDDFKRIQQWTVFCGAGGIPFMNIADYFEYSSTVSSPTSC